MYDKALLRAHLVKEESYENFPYVDTVGKVSIGVGHNLTDKGIPDEIVDRLLELDIEEAEALLDARISWWRKLDDMRQLVLMDMAFNMGSRLFTFVNTLAAMKRGEYLAAAKGMRASKWYGQVGARAETLALIMETGENHV